MEIRGATLLPARREDVELRTEDGLTLVGELSVPLDTEPVATLVTLHPLPTHGGFMDSHILRKAAARLPALADIAVLRFNTRGTTSARGTSDGAFDGGALERHDVAAAMRFVEERGLPHPWLLGWSFGTELALKYGREHDVEGAVLLSPPLHRATDDEVAAWAGDRRRARPRRPSGSRRCRRRRSSPSKAASTSGWGRRRPDACWTRSWPW
ncbi:MAG: putative hydrolase of the alpha/beta superfamily [Microbacterium sp.]|nr:putative hydrolase of the alpha/beta superfamily [Microbacterium sp.]